MLVLAPLEGEWWQDSEREILKYPSRLLYNLPLFLNILFAKMARGGVIYDWTF